jgi:hypothetical protein
MGQVSNWGGHLMAMHLDHDGVTNVGDLLPSRPSAFGTSNKTPDNGPAFLKTKDGQLISNDGTTNRVVIGQRSDGSYGIKVSQSGKDALTGTNDQMVMNSDFNQFKIIGKGTGTVTVAGGEELTTTIPHGLGFAPAVVAYVSTTWAPGAYFPVPRMRVNTSTLSFDNLAEVYTDATNVTLYAGSFNPATDGTYTYRYYLLQETAS